MNKQTGSQDKSLATGVDSSISFQRGMSVLKSSVVENVMMLNSLQDTGERHLQQSIMLSVDADDLKKKWGKGTEGGKDGKTERE